MTQGISISAALFCIALTGCATRQTYLERGNRLFQSGRFSDASLNYRKAIQKDPQFGEAYYRLGLSAIKQDQGKEAYDALLRASELAPANIDAKEKLASLALTFYLADPRRPRNYYDQVARLSDELRRRDANSFEGLRLEGYLALTDHKLARAIELFRRAVKIKPTDPTVPTALVEVLFQDGQNAEAEALGSDLIAHKAHGPIYALLYSRYYNSGRIAQAEEVLKAQVEADPKQAASIIELARHYARVSKPAEMHAALERLISDPKSFPQARLQVADYYLAIHDYNEALRYYREGAQQQSKPEDRILYQKRIANTLIAAGHKDEAATVVEQILKQQPNDDEAREVRASLWLDTGVPDRVQAASREFRDLLGRRGANPLLWVKAGRASRLTGDLKTARAQFLEAIRRKSDLVAPRYDLAEISLEEQKPQEAAQFSSEIFALQPKDPRARVLHAAGVMGTGGNDAARAELLQTLKEFPNYADAQMQLGALALKEKKYDEAAKLFAKLSSDDPRAASGLASAYSGLKRTDAASQAVEQALKKTPNSALLRAQLASLAVREGKYDVAAAELRKAIALDPGSVEQRLRLGEVYELQGDHERAISAYREAQQLPAANAVATMSLAAALARAGRTQEAREQYQSILRSHPDDAAALNSLAYLLSSTGGDLDEAIRLAQRAVETVPGQPNFRDTMGYIYLKKGMLGSAIQTFTNLARKYPAYPTFRYHLGLALLENGDKKGARRELDAALANHPSREEESKIREIAAKI